MVDALRHDYITPQDAPFLHELGQQGAKGSLIPSFGFEPDGAYFSGLNPEECDGGAQYWRNPNEQLFHLARLFGFLYRWPIPGWRKNVRRAARLLAQTLAKDSLTQKLASTSEIPFELLEQFSTPMKKMAHEPGFSPTPTIFDVVRTNGGKFFFHGYPEFKVDSGNVIKRYLAEEHGGNHLAFLFLGDLDGIGHHYGPNSNERRTALQRLDARLKQIHEHAHHHYKYVDLLIFGDHGMAEVTQHIDLREIISRLGLDKSKDAYFLDSTMARFWIADNVRKQQLIDALDRHAGGHVLTQTEHEKYQIRYPHNYFGDVIYAVDDHALIHPSFYCSGNNPPKGMHGYLPGCRDNESTFVLYGEKARGLGNLDRIDMRRVFPTILDMLGVKNSSPIPHQLQSLLP